jgi:hypothetical protein
MKHTIQTLALVLVTFVSYAAIVTTLRAATDFSEQSKQYYLAKKAAEWDCREQCCKEYRHCLHEQMQGKKGRYALANAIDACKELRKKCTDCKRVCKRDWKASHKLANYATVDTPSPDASATSTS